MSLLRELADRIGEYPLVLAAVRDPSGILVDAGKTLIVGAVGALMASYVQQQVSVSEGHILAAKLTAVESKLDQLIEERGIVRDRVQRVDELIRSDLVQHDDLSRFGMRLDGLEKRATEQESRVHDLEYWVHDRSTGPRRK